ncbi:HlyD family efflux transporter periplasmic adaptor subunit [Mesobaculum littorinae]|uniref:HlyD family efflux transporter periplasmic adaptor subunit n=1 Tax=Mesobaculum littorinae TaxID=2486419 RepID=A0A438AHZ8_9RHOB|nr:HlyD family efflux transporter periplasmic adaptor subunit [Mesobaculum littorinae]RVV98356.1 HlyD family efflux transporter periplasmic adaptor subunit [Mesobaculum littorinae]
MRFLTRSLLGIFLLAATLGLLALAAGTLLRAVEVRMADEGFSRPARERTFAVNVLSYDSETVVPVLSTFGEIRSRRTLDLRATVAGEVVELGPGVEEGGAVEAGQLLFRLDPTDAETALEIARTDLKDAEAELRDARRSLDISRDDLASAEAQSELRARAATRQRDLTSRGLGAESEAETAELAAASAEQAVLSRRQALADAQARIDSATTALSRQRIALSEAERTVEDTRIVAGFDGVISDLAVTEGGLVSNSEVLAQLVDPQALEVAFRVSTPQYARLLDASGGLLDADVSVSLDVNGYSIATTGQISRESAAVAEGQTGRLLFATLDGAAGFRPGDFATVAIEEPPLPRVARLPAAAVDAGNSVLVVGEDSRLSVAPVELLRRQGDAVLVRADLEGARIVAERSPLLGAGIKVTVTDPMGEAGTAEDTAAATDAETPPMVALSAERRARLVAFVEASDAMPSEAKQRVLAQLREAEVPSDMVARIESRMGG